MSVLYVRTYVSTRTDAAWCRPSGNRRLDTARVQEECYESCVKLLRECVVRSYVCLLNFAASAIAPAKLKITSTEVRPSKFDQIVNVQKVKRL